MTVIVNSGSTLVVPASGLTLTADSTIAAGGELVGFSGGTITGGFDLINDGLIFANTPGGMTIDTGSFTNQGTVLYGGNSTLTVQSSVNLTNLSDGTLTGGIWNFGGLYLLDGTISTDDATLELGDAGDFEVGPGGTGTQLISNTLTEVGTGGVLDIDGAAWATPGPLNVDGVLGTGALSLSAAGGVTVSATGTLIGNNEIVSPLTVNGSLIVDASMQLDSPLSGTGSVTVAQGELALMSPGTLAGAITVNDGEVVVGGPGVLNDLNAGNPVSVGTVTITGTVNGGGQLDIQNVAGSSPINALELDNVTSVNVGFAGAVTGPDFGELILDQPSSFSGAVFDFNNDSTIVLTGIIGNTATWSNDTLTVMNNSTSVYAMALDPAIALEKFSQLVTLQTYGTGNFVATPNDISDNTTITVSGIQDFAATCFRAGTRIGAPCGLIAVECLSPGDLVLSRYGATRRIVWIGHREVDCRRHPDPRSVWPVRISPNAFAPGQPRGELFLSPDHAVFIDDVLIPVRLLINGTTIRPIETSRVTWYHVELEDHDVVFAEGLPVESYLDQDDRGFFANGGTPVRLFPDFAARTWEMAGCAPLVLTGAKLARVRAMLERRGRDGMLLDRATRDVA